MTLVPAHPHRDQCPGGSTPGTAKEKENDRVKEGVEREKRGVDKRRVFMPRDASSASGPRGLMPAAGVGTQLMATWKMWQRSAARTERTERGCYA